MKVKDAVELLSKFDPEFEIIGQYNGGDKLWPIGWVEIAKVPGDNTMVVIQVKSESSIVHMKDARDNEWNSILETE